MSNGSSECKSQLEHCPQISVFKASMGLHDLLQTYELDFLPKRKLEGDMGDCGHRYETDFLPKKKAEGET